MEKRGQFTFYRSFYDAVKEHEEKIQLNVLMAILRYVFEEKEPNGLGSTEKSVFVLIKPVLDSGRKKAVAGRLGGSAKKKQKQSKGEKEVEIENEVEKEVEIEIDTEKDSYIGVGGFEIFWEKYPVKIDELTCRDIFASLEESEDVILKGLDNWLGCRQWRKAEGRYIPRPAKWLSEKHYLQTPEQAVPMGATGQLGQAEIEAIHAMMRGEV